MLVELLLHLTQAKQVPRSLTPLMLVYAAVSVTAGRQAEELI